MTPQKHPPAFAGSTPQSPSSYWLAWMFVVLLGAVQVYFFDVTFHGPDQIRDVDIARRLIHQHEWPLNGPPLFGERFYLPPGFYYLLALPLWVRDTEAAIFVAFGLLFAMSVGYLLRVVNARMGPRHALAYAVLAFPLFGCFYTHSAWNPALVMTLSNTVLALFIQLIHHRPHAALWLPLAAFLLVQIHPSAVPLLAGLGVYAAVNLRSVLNRAGLASLGIVVGLTSWWLVRSGSAAKLLAPTAAPAAVGSAPRPHWLENLLDLEKWRDAVLMPYSAIGSLEPPIAGLTAFAGFHTALLWLGVLLGVALAFRERTLRWIATTTALWLLVSMAFLSQGAFWHLDVVHPWLAVLGAWGLARASEKAQLSTARFNALGAALLAIVAAAHLALYLGFEKRGKYDLALSGLFFPALEAQGYRIPGYTFRHMKAMHDNLTSRGICQNDVVGLEALVLGDAVSRTLNAPCPATAQADSKERTLHFVAGVHDSRLFDFTRGLQPAAVVGASALYAVASNGLTVNGQAKSNLLSSTKMNYMTFRPARLDDGLRIAVPAAAETLLRVALRCGQDYPLARDQHWTIQGAALKKPIKSAHHRYLGSNYYDLEWTLTMPAGQSHGATVSTTLGALDCDVSAIARPTRAD